MNSPFEPLEPNLRQALRDLADVPGSVNMADRALTRAKGIRHGRTALIGAGALAAVLMVAPLLAYAGSQNGSTNGGGIDPGAVASGAPATPKNVMTDCPPAPSVSPDVKEVAEPNWPEFVKLTIAKLPPRDDYVMQSGYGVCRWEQTEATSPLSNAYAVINLGSNRNHGHLTVDLFAHVDLTFMPATCADARAQIEALGNAVLVCVDGTADSPMVVGVGFGVSGGGDLIVTAVYADRRAVSIGSLAPGGTGAPTIGVDALRVVVTDRALVNLLPAG